MKFRALFFAVVIISLSFIINCSFVGSKKPIGEKVNLEPLEWDGLWVERKHTENFYFIKVMENSVIKLLVVSTENNKLESKSIKIFLTQYKNYYLANIQKKYFEDDSDDNNSKVFLWFLIKKGKNSINIFQPNDDFFKHAIKKGILKGEIKRDLVLLKSNPSKILDIISKGKIFESFNKEEILKLKRILDFNSN